MDYEKRIEISADNNIDDQMKSVVSANFLCNFMKKPEYLIETLRHMAFRPRYFEEKIGYLNIPNRTTITFPMTCFCDIPLSKASKHMEIYGCYGLALNKLFCIKKDVQPITYLNRNSRIAKEISNAFQQLFEATEDIDEKWEFLPDVLLSQLLFTKPITGYMSRKDHQIEHLIFKDECEWRYVPEMPKGMPIIMPEEHNNDKGRDTYSNALAKYRSTWFPFKVENIDYIIVPSEAEALNMIKSIMDMRSKNREEKHRLISRIEVADKFCDNFV